MAKEKFAGERELNQKIYEGRGGRWNYKAGKRGGGDYNQIEEAPKRGWGERMVRAVARKVNYELPEFTSYQERKQAWENREYAAAVERAKKRRKERGSGKERPIPSYYK